MAGTTLCFKRYEKKYFLSSLQYDAVLKEIEKHLTPDKFYRSRVCNIYYDTEDWRLIRDSIEKPNYKEKLRVRSYGVPKSNDKVFVEIKKKFDGIVYKRRAEVSAALAQSTLCGGSHSGSSQIENEIDWFQSFYKTKPRVFIAYDRLSFTGVVDEGLRITFDSDICFRTDRLNLTLGDDGTKLFENGKVLMEIKIPGACPLWLCRLLSENSIYPTSFSKYGTVYRNEILKKKTGGLYSA